MSNIILFHKGLVHPESAKILEAIEDCDVPMLSGSIKKVEISSRKMEQYLVHNSKGIIIKHLPTFIMSDELGTVILGNNLDHIVSLVKRQVSHGQ